MVSGVLNPESESLLWAGVTARTISKLQASLGWPKEWRKQDYKGRYWRTETGYEATRSDEVAHHTDVRKL